MNVRPVHVRTVRRASTTMSATSVFVRHGTPDISAKEVSNVCTTDILNCYIHSSRSN